MTGKPLSPQREHFAQLVGGGRSQSDAYREVYPKSKKWKDSAVHTQASILMSTPKVLERVAEIRAVGAESAELEAGDVMREIKRVAFSDIGSIMNEDGKVKLPNELDAATRAAIASFEIDEFGRIKYKFWEKNAALEKAAKILGLFERDNKQKAAELVGVVRLVALGDGVAK